MNSAIDSEPGTSRNPLRVAIVGSGPSGFYAAEALFKAGLTVSVDMLERLPVPFGLVRYGVAPDHPKLKQVSLVFEKIARSPGFAFLGNVALGRDVNLEQLRETHHAIILAYGAETDRRLGIPNEDLSGSHTATEFVGWYNGHPEYRDRCFELSGETAVIIGQGNVALDVARILAKPIDQLRHTDIAEHALDALAASRIRDIHLVGRRGPAQTSFTAKELRELGELTDCGTRLAAEDLVLGSTCRAELEDKNNLNAVTNLELFRRWAATEPGESKRRIHFHFFKSPVELGGDTRLRRVVLERNRLCGEPFSQRSYATGRHVELSSDLIFRSIGYRGQPLPGLPFDDARGVIPHIAGRVGDCPGLYAVGWIKRGPSGIIGTNRADAVDTVKSVLADVAAFDRRPKPGAAGLRVALSQTSTRVLGYADWQRIDAEERRLGAEKAKPREKLTRVSEMLEVAGATPRLS